jgi:uncharacterized protein (TIGR03545 family)
MRWKWILPRLLLVVMIWAFLRWGLDPALRHGLVSGLQSATGAKVDVAGLRTGFFPPTVIIEGTAVASPRRPGRNLFEFERLQLQLEPDSLSHRRFVVERGEIRNLRFDTNRSDDGRLAPDEKSDSTEPSWMKEQLKEVSDQWLHQLAEQARAQLDPNTLETWRLGSGKFDKWDSRFRDLADRARSLEPRAMAVKDGFESIRGLEPLEQIERGLQLAQEVDVIVREAEQMQRELQAIAPEVKLDYEELNVARLRDEEMIRHKLTLLKPDGRRISQTLLGPAMYRRVQQLLTWVQAIQEYRRDLSEQVRPPRMEGRVFSVVETKPAPAFLLKHLALSGTISIDEGPVPYAAAIRNVTEQPALLGRSSTFELRAAGRRPLMLSMTVDATGADWQSELEASYRDDEGLPVVAGKQGEVWFEGGLRNMDWSLKMKLGGDRLQGFVSLKSDIEGLSFWASEDVRPEVVEAANEALGAVTKFDAVAAFTGTLLKPEINLSSGIGEQIAAGVRQAFLTQLEKARTRLLEELDERAAEQLARLKARCSSEYQELLADNGKLLEQVREVRTVLTSLQGGRLDAGMLVRQASQSKLLREKDRAKLEQVDRVLTEFEGAMQGRIPQALIQKLPIPSDALPAGLPTLTIPGFLPGMLPGLLPQTTAEMTGGRSAGGASAPALPGSVEQPISTRVEDLLPMALPGLFPGLFPALNPGMPQPNGGVSAGSAGGQKATAGASKGAVPSTKSQPAGTPQLLPFFRPRAKR